MLLFIFWIALSFMVAGIWGTERRIGMMGSLLCCLILSPLIGFIITIVSPSEKEEEKRKEDVKLQEQQIEELKKIKNSISNSSVVAELEKLNALLKQNAITQEEFDLLKSKLLNS